MPGLAKNILITAGGTKEDIDPVRGITNYATGRLGCLIAERFLDNNTTVTYEHGENTVRHNVTYIHGENAMRPNNCPNLHLISIRNTHQLQKELEDAMHARPYAAVIHSMAVSDYAPYEPATEKISSESPYLVVVLKKLPKIIKRVKEIQPDTILVGFKLLSDANDDKLIKAANKQIAESGSDYVLANAQENIQGDQHRALLIDRSGVVGRFDTKNEIAEAIWQTVQG